MMQRSVLRVSLTVAIIWHIEYQKRFRIIDTENIQNLQVLFCSLLQKFKVFSHQTKTIWSKNTHIIMINKAILAHHSRLRLYGALNIKISSGSLTQKIFRIEIAQIFLLLCELTVFPTKPRPQDLRKHRFWQYNEAILAHHSRLRFYRALNIKRGSGSLTLNIEYSRNLQALFCSLIHRFTVFSQKIKTIKADTALPWVVPLKGLVTLIDIFILQRIEYQEDIFIVGQSFFLVYIFHFNSKCSLLVFCGLGIDSNSGNPGTHILWYYFQKNIS